MNRDYIDIFECEPVDLIKPPNWSLTEAVEKYKELIRLYEKTKFNLNSFREIYIKPLINSRKNISGISGGGVAKNTEQLYEMNYLQTKLDLNN